MEEYRKEFLFEKRVNMIIIVLELSICLTDARKIK
jgi:hypothetical protein